MAAKTELHKDIKITSNVPATLMPGDTALHEVTLESRWPIDLTVRITSTGGDRNTIRYINEPNPIQWEVEQLRLTGSSRRFGGGPSPITVQADMHNDPNLPPPPGKINQIITTVFQLEGTRPLTCGSVFVNVRS